MIRKSLRQVIPLFEFFACGSIAVAAHKTAAKPVDFALEMPAVMLYIEACSGTIDFPCSGPILARGTIFPVCSVLIRHSYFFQSVIVSPITFVILFIIKIINDASSQNAICITIGTMVIRIKFFVVDFTFSH